MVESRDTDYEHYIKCGDCGWEGWSAWMRHGYQSYGEDVEPMDFCPKCSASEEIAEVFLTCHRICHKCNERFLCFTALNNIPKNEIGFFSKGVEQWLKS